MGQEGVRKEGDSRLLILLDLIPVPQLCFESKNAVLILNFTKY